MYNPVPPPVASSYAERIAWMHAPVRLTPGYLPWVVRRLLEMALYRFFCRFEQTLLALHELHQQGKLQPWPEQAQQATAAPRTRRYHYKSTPTAPARSAGAEHVQVAAEISPEVTTDAAEAAGEAAVALRPAWSRRAVGCQSRACSRPLVGGRLEYGRWSLTDRCRSATGSRAAGRGGKRASKSFRLVYKIYA